MESGPRDPLLDSLRSEIVETEKLQTDTARWKLIAVAAIVSAAFGAFSSAPGNEKHFELLFAVPAVCIFCDLTSSHLMMRILVIGAFLRLGGDKYEKFCHDLRHAIPLTGVIPDKGESRSNPFGYEQSSIFLTSGALIFSLCPIGAFLFESSESGLAIPLITFGLLGWLISLFQFNHLDRKIRQLERTTRPHTNDQESATEPAASGSKG